MYIGKYKLDYLFNPPNLFLVFVLVVVLYNSILQINLLPAKTASPEETIFEFLVLDKHGESFGSKHYSAWYKQSLTLVKTNRYLVPGSKYRVLGSLLSINLENNYEIGLGFTTQISVKKILDKDQNCSAICKLLQSRNQLRNKINKKFLELACQKWQFLNFLYFNTTCSDQAGLSVGLITGGTELFEKSTKSNFKKLGFMHLVAVSGFQVGLVVSFLEFLVQNINLTRIRKFLFSLLGIALLIFVVGPEPPVLRSSLSISLSLFSLFLLGRRLDTKRALIYSAIILLVINPFYLVSASFQLSFLASLGLVTTLNIDNLGQEGLLSSIKEIITASVSSFFFTLPVIVTFGGYNFFGILMNILITPVIPLLTIFNILALVPIIGDLFYFPSLVIQSLILFPTNYLGPMVADLNISKLSGMGIIIYYLCLLITVEVFKKNVPKINLFGHH